MSLSTLNKQTNKADARRSLRRFQQNGDPELDPDNDTHVQAYCALRALSAHVSAKKIKEYLETAKSSFSTGVNTEEPYWCVPKTNFTNGLPQEIKDAVVEPEGDDDNWGVNGWKVDSANFYIVDQVIPRTSLGKGVFIIRHFAGHSTKCNMNPRPPSAASSGAMGNNIRVCTCLSCPSAHPHPPT